MTPALRLPTPPCARYWLVRVVGLLSLSAPRKTRQWVTRRTGGYVRGPTSARLWPERRHRVATRSIHLAQPRHGHDRSLARDDSSRAPPIPSAPILARPPVAP